MKNILVTGSGGIGGVNFIRALRSTKEDFFIVGTDFNQYYLEFPDVDVRVNTPRHSDPKFILEIKQIISKHSIDFLHPQPSSEALVISQDDELKSKTFLPSSSVISHDKSTTQKILWYSEAAKTTLGTINLAITTSSCFLESHRVPQAEGAAKLMTTRFSLTNTTITITVSPRTAAFTAWKCRAALRRQ